MKIQGIISAAVLTFSALLSAPTFACSPDNGGIKSSILSTEPTQYETLGCGVFDVSGEYLQQDSSFSDSWKFIAAENMLASISIFDIEPEGSETVSEDFDTTKIFDIKHLIIALFNNDSGALIGAAGENQTLTGLTLQAGQWYTLKVIGYAAGQSGGAYQGSLDTVCVSEVPLGSAAPLLGSALGLLALRRRKHASANVAA